MSLKQTLLRALEYVQSPSGDLKAKLRAGELPGVDAQELFSALEVEQLMSTDSSRLSPKDRERAQAVVDVGMMEEGGQPYAVMADSIRRVLKRLDMVEGERTRATCKAIRQSAAFASYHARIEPELKRAS